MNSSDQALVAKILNGDEAAFRLFFKAYFPRLFRFALYRLNGDADLAEDVAQITLTKALDNLSGYRGRSSAPELDVHHLS